MAMLYKMALTWATLFQWVFSYIVETDVYFIIIEHVTKMLEHMCIRMYRFVTHLLYIYYTFNEPGAHRFMLQHALNIVQ